MLREQEEIQKDLLKTEAKLESLQEKTATLVDKGGEVTPIKTIKTTFADIVKIFALPVILIIGMIGLFYLGSHQSQHDLEEKIGKNYLVTEQTIKNFKFESNANVTDKIKERLKSIKEKEFKTEAELNESLQALIIPGIDKLENEGEANRYRNETILAVLDPQPLSGFRVDGLTINRLLSATIITEDTTNNILLDELYLLKYRKFTTQQQLAELSKNINRYSKLLSANATYFKISANVINDSLKATINTTSSKGNEDAFRFESSSGSRKELLNELTGFRITDDVLTTLINNLQPIPENKESVDSAQKKQKKNKNQKKDSANKEPDIKPIQLPLAMVIKRLELIKDKKFNSREELAQALESYIIPKRESEYLDAEIAKACRESICLLVKAEHDQTNISNSSLLGDIDKAIFDKESSLRVLFKFFTVLFSICLVLGFIMLLIKIVKMLPFKIDEANKEMVGMMNDQIKVGDKEGGARGGVSSMMGLLALLGLSAIVLTVVFSLEDNSRAIAAASANPKMNSFNNGNGNFNDAEYNERLMDLLTENQRTFEKLSESMNKLKVPPELKIDTGAINKLQTSVDNYTSALKTEIQDLNKSSINIREQILKQSMIDRGMMLRTISQVSNQQDTLDLLIKELMAIKNSPPAPNPPGSTSITVILSDLIDNLEKLRPIIVLLGNGDKTKQEEAVKLIGIIEQRLKIIMNNNSATSIDQINNTLKCEFDRKKLLQERHLFSRIGDFFTGVKQDFCPQCPNMVPQSKNKTTKKDNSSKSSKSEKSAPNPTVSQPVNNPNKKEQD